MDTAIEIQNLNEAFYMAPIPLGTYESKYSSSN